MTSRERVLTALNHEEPDRVPLFFGTSGVTSILGGIRSGRLRMRSFTGGLIYSMLFRLPRRKMIEFAVAAGCLKHSIPGDFNLVSIDEVQALADGDATGRIRR